jgi:hypothetical protein
VYVRAVVVPRTVRSAKGACHTQPVTSSYSFRAELWHYPGVAGWHFLTLPPDVAGDLREESAAVRKGFGSVKVTAVIAGHTCETSVFPDSKSGSYLLPVKKAVRDAAHLSAGDNVAVQLDIQSGQ